MIQIYAGLWVMGDDLDPDVAVAALDGVDVRAARRRGDVKRNGRRSERRHVWITTVDTIRSSIEESLDDLFARLEPVWAALVDLSRTWQVSIECYVKLYGEPNSVGPVFGFEARHVRRAAELGSDLLIDLQDYRRTDLQQDHPTG